MFVSEGNIIRSTLIISRGKGLLLINLKGQLANSLNCFLIC